MLHPASFVFNREMQMLPESPRSCTFNVVYSLFRHVRQQTIYSYCVQVALKSLLKFTHDCSWSIWPVLDVI